MNFFKDRICFLTILVIILFFALPAKTQVTIGSPNPPQKFSVLELISQESGLRLPQLTSQERDSLKLNELTNPDTIQAAKGLVIYNIDTDCLEFWNGAKWVSLCSSVVPVLNVNPNSLTFDATGEPAQNVTVATNIPAGWTVTSIPSWITVTPTSGTGSSISVTASANPNPEPRSDTIVIAAGALTDTITVTQLELVTLSGDGSSTNPYIICSPQQLDAVRDEPNAYYQLCGNIDLTAYLATGGEGYAKWGVNGWMPIGDSTTPFTGTIDGAGYTISGLRISRAGTNEIGLFGVLFNSGAIKNLTLNISNNITNSTGTYVGGLVGRLSGTSTISKCSVTGSGTISGGSYIGGVAGQINNASIVTKCYSSVNISGSNSVGGIAGWVGEAGRGNGTITNCYATGSVTGGGSNIGGLVGQLYNGIIDSCYVTGAVSGTGSGSTDVVGGIAGRITLASCRVSNCVALNPSVSTAYGTTVGRVAGILTNGTLNNNWGATMTVTTGSGPKSPLANTGDGLDGADATTLYNSATWWTTASPSGPGWDSSIWNFADGQLPTLK